ncbi:MAG: sulfurtransferase [Chloroflexi bacterium]|nr:sulfurtransferase [Chloroflexota bacterium]
MTLIIPSPLINAAWLHDHVAHPDLRILDCTMRILAEEHGKRIESGRDQWELGHIPGSTFADLDHELSEPNTSMRFSWPSAARFAAGMAAHGVGEGACVILYDSDMNVWAARLWWMLRAFGFDNAAVLNGGWRAWQNEQYPISTTVTVPAPASFISRPRPHLVAHKADVIAAQDSPACQINALSAENYAAARIPGSIHISARTLVDPDTHVFLPRSVLRRWFENAGALPDNQVITYCGAGIVASSDALILTLLGYDDVSMYDGSLEEWLADPTLSVEADV